MNLDVKMPDDCCGGGNAPLQNGWDDSQIANNDEYVKGSVLDLHDKGYRWSLKNIKDQYEDADDIHRIAIYLKYQKIKCFKYNSDLDHESSTSCFFESKLSLSKDLDWFIIVNRSNIRTR